MSLHQKYYDRLTSALDDLLRCKRYCEVMIESPVGESFSTERTKYEGLNSSSIISYGRIFTTANSEYKEEIGNRFGKLRMSFINGLSDNERKFHDRVLTKRETVIAHSDAESRNIQHFNNSSLPVYRNVHYPMEHSEVKVFLGIVSEFISAIGSEQSRVGNFAFENDIFTPS